MIAPPTPAPSAGALNVIASLLEQRTGQQIAANRAWRVETALKPLLREEGLASLDALVARLVRDADLTLSERTVEALLNQETSFFRDPGVIDQIHVAARAMQADSPDRRLRLWSAACSTGQEPLSLAMLFSEHPEWADRMPDIHATDISTSAIARAKAGRFTQFEVQRGLPIKRMVRWFEPAGNDWQASPELISRIQFRRHNLVGEPPLPGRFDVILCRNVLLYLSHPLRRQIFDDLAQALRPGGLLVLGASETVIGQTDALIPCRTFRGFYRRALEARPLGAPLTLAR